MKVITFDNLPEAVSELYAKLNNIENLLTSNQQETPKDRLMTVQEAALFLSLSTSTVYTKISNGTIPHMKDGKRVYFLESELTDYMKSKRVQTQQERIEKAHLHVKAKK